MRILIYRTGRLGDFLVAVPAIRLVRKAFPEARITLVTCVSSRKQVAEKSKNYSDLAFLPPWIAFIYPGTVDEVFYFTSLRDWTGLGRLKAQLAVRQFDHAFILPFALEPLRTRLKKWLFLRALGVNCKIYGLRSENQRLFQPIGHIHQVEVGLSIVRQCPAIASQPDQSVTFDLNVAKHDNAWADAEFARQGWDTGKVVAVFAGGTHAHKKWDSENFAAVCRRLGEDLSLKFVYVGSAAERTLADPATKELPGRCWNYCGETSLGQLAALLQKCVLLFGNDSGPCHLAAAVCTPCVAVMSEVHAPGVWEPWGPNAQALRNPVPCRGCGCETHCPIGNEICIRGISVDSAVAACKLALNQGRLISNY